MAHFPFFLVGFIPATLALFMLGISLMRGGLVQGYTEEEETNIYAWVGFTGLVFGVLDLINKLPVFASVAIGVGAGYVFSALLVYLVSRDNQRSLECQQA